MGGEEIPDMILDPCPANGYHDGEVPDGLEICWKSYSDFIQSVTHYTPITFFVNRIFSI